MVVRVGRVARGVCIALGLSACFRIGYAPRAGHWADGGPPSGFDASAREGGTIDPNAVDPNAVDPNPREAGEQDAMPGGTASGDASPADATAGDATAGGANQPDASQPDAGAGSDPLLIHRYRFEGSGTTAVDSAGGSAGDGLIVNTSLTGTGSLTLTFGGDEYVDLPDGIVSSLTDATFEVWVTWDGQLAPSYHPRIFDFGSNTGGAGGLGSPTSFIYLTPSYNQNGVTRASYSADGTVRVQADAKQSWLPLGVVQSVHFAVLFDDGAGTMTLYLNGDLIMSSDVPGSLSDLDDVNNWLGRSPVAGDSHFGGEIHEFRIYRGLLSQATISKHVADGPDAD